MTQIRICNQNRACFHASDVESLASRCQRDQTVTNLRNHHIGDMMLSPGHTLGSITYVVGDAAFVHDTFMHVDVGTSRADFPGGSSSVLYDSLQRILELPDETRLFIGHDYPPVKDREDPAWEATVAEHREKNPHVGGGASREDYVKLRDERDATLGLPDRMLYALQVNLRGGQLPEAEADGNSYFKIPANKF